MVTQKMPWADKEHMEVIQKVIYEGAHPVIQTILKVAKTSSSLIM